MDTQVCKNCGAEKSFSEFFKIRTNRNGLDVKCKSCRKAINDNYLELNKRKLEEKVVDELTTQTCKSCDIEKPLSEFFKNSAKANGHDAKCKICRRQRNKEVTGLNIEARQESSRNYYLNNKESIIEKKHAYYAENRERIIKRKVEYQQKNKETITKRQKEWRLKNSSHVSEKSKLDRELVKQSLFELIGHVCVICGESEPRFLTTDHKNNDGHLHRVHGSIGWKRKILLGELDHHDFQTMCHNCNSSKYRVNPVHHLSNKPTFGISKTCNLCGEEKDLSFFNSQTSHEKNRCLVCVMSVKRDRINSILKSFGGKCACCGDDDLTHLCIDHINNDGSLKREEGDGSGVDILSKLSRGLLNKEEYQILCFNCNYSKHENGGTCIHKTTNQSILTPTYRNPDRESHELKDFEFDSVKFKILEHEDGIRDFLNKFHYGGFGRNSSHVYLFKLNGEIVGVAKFAPPVRQGIAPRFKLNNDQVMELDRFCIHPSYHKKNFASYAMSKVIKLFKSDYPEVKKLVSFADPRFGHSGTIYQASNWTFDGKTTRSYFYENDSGQEINKKTLYGYAKKNNMKEAECASKLGYKKVHTPPKHRYFFDL